MSDELKEKHLYYPIGVIVLGLEVELGSTLDLWPAKPKVKQVAFTVTRLLPTGVTSEFPLRVDNPTKVTFISVIGPGVLTRVAAAEWGCIELAGEDEGRLFFAPNKVLSSGHRCSVAVKCNPALFMLDQGDPNQLIERKEEVHDSSPEWGEVPS